MIRNPLAGALADSLEWTPGVVYLAFNTGFKNKPGKANAFLLI